MLAVRTFGGLAVEHDGAVRGGAAARRKTLALLALLAAAGKKGLSRDKLIAYLWPEADTAHGHHLLKQTCYALRRELHEPQFFLGRDELRLNAAVVESDVQAFDDALERGDRERAVGLYTGPFLDGFYLNGPGEFERWAETERARIAQQVCAALEALAREAARHGDHARAACWWRRLAALDPLSDHVALGVMEALVTAGDRAGALQFARLHERLLREEVDAAPERAVVALAERLRRERERRPPALLRFASDRRPPDAPSPAVAARPPSGPRVARLVRLLPLGLALAVLGVVALVSRAGQAAGLDPDLIAVAPFEVLAPNVEPWREGLVDVLSGGLDGAGRLRAVPPSLVLRNWRGRADAVSATDLGRRTRARFVLFGALLAAGHDSVRLRGTLVDAASGKTLAELAYLDAADHVDRLTDSVVLAVRRKVGAPAVASGGHFVTGRVLGPDGKRSICEYLPTAAIVTARLLDVHPPRFGGFAAFACPEYTLRIPAPDSGPWHLRVDLPRTAPLGRFVERNLETEVAVDTPRDIVIHEGTGLGGRVTFDGKPVAGVAFVMGYEAQAGRMATSGGSGPDGRWRDFLGRAPPPLQPGIRYTLNQACRYLGARVVRGPPAGGFLFPTELRSLECKLMPGRGSRLTHDLTRLVLTPLPGDIGGLSDDFARDPGYGWGVQFPIATGQSPAHDPSASQLYQGGLLIGIAPDRVLAGTTVRGIAACGPRCRTLWSDPNVQLAAAPGGGKHVTWRYADAGSPDGVGLRVAQESFDGRPPADYVLFRFTFTNGGQAATTFHAGFFGDWDIGRDGEDDMGQTAMEGRLMYQMNGDGSGPYLGTLLTGDAPISGNFFYRAVILPSAKDQVDALAGRLVQRATDAVGDVRYIHGAGPFTLDHDQSAELWIAVVAGDTRKQLLANATAAATDIAQRRGQALVRTVR